MRSVNKCAFSDGWKRFAKIEKSLILGRRHQVGKGAELSWGDDYKLDQTVIGRCREAGEATKWWRDYNVSRQAILHVICEGICLQIHSGYIFTPRFVLDHLPLSSQIGPSPEPNVAFTLILSHADKFRLGGWRGISTAGVGYWMSPIHEEGSLELNVVLFYQAYLPSHLEPRSEEQHFSPHQRTLHW